MPGTFRALALAFWIACVVFVAVPHGSPAKARFHQPAQPVPHWHGPLGE